MKKWIFYTSLLIFFLPSVTQAQYVMLEDFEGYSSAQIDGFGGDYILTNDNDLGFWYIQGDNPTQDSNPIRWTRPAKIYQTYNGFKSLEHNRTYFSYYLNNSATTTIEAGGQQSISYWVYVPMPDDFAQYENVNLTIWQNLYIGRGDFYNVGTSRNLQRRIFHDYFYVDSTQWALALYDDAEYINNPDNSVYAYGGKFDEWNLVYIVLDFDTGDVTYSLNGNDSVTINDTSFINPNLTIPFAYFTGIEFRGASVILETGTRQNVYDEQLQRVYTIDDFELNATPPLSWRETCNVYFDEYASTTFREATDYGNDRPYTSGFVFKPTAPCDVGSVLARVEFEGDFDDDIAIRVYELPTLSSDLSLLYYLGKSYYESNVDGTGILMSRFNFEKTFRLMPDRYYLFNFIAKDHASSTWDNGDGFNVATYNNPNSNGDVWRGYEDTGALIYSYDYNTQFQFLGYTDDINAIVLSQPCNLVSTYGTTGTGNYQECIHAISDIEYAPPIIFDGISTGRTTDFNNGEYYLTQTLTTPENEILFYTEDKIATGVNYNFNNEIDLNALLYNEVDKSKLYKYQICQKDTRTIQDYDLNLDAFYAEVGSAICIEVHIGWNMTAEQAGDILNNLRRQSDDGETLDVEDWWTKNCTYTTLSDYTNVFKSLKCGLVWAFNPSEKTIDRFFTLRDNLLYTIPIGYATHIYTDVKTALTSTSTEAFNKDIEVGKIFGKEGATTTIEMDNLLKYSYMWQPIQRLFDYIMYILLALGLLYWGLRQRL